MIFLSVGLPGRFATWCDTVIARLAAILDPNVALISWPTTANMFGYQDLESGLDVLAQALIRENPVHLVMGARQPDEQLRLALLDERTPLVLALDDPRNACREFLIEGGASVRQAVRAVANSCPLVMRYASLPGALTLHAESVATDPLAAVASIAAHFGFQVDCVELERIVADLAENGPFVTADRTEELPVDERRTIDGALSGYAEHFAGRNLGGLVWRRELFALAQDGSQSPTDVLDISGPPRILIYGPYIHLPPGSWSARIVLGFSEAAVGHSFNVDAFSGEPLVSRTIRPDSSGVHATDIVFSAPAAQGQGVELRVWVVDGVRNGELAFGYAVLHQIFEDQELTFVQSQDDFKAALLL